MNGQSLLLRQVHPSFIQAGEFTSQVFRPTPKDEKKLSAYNGDMITPEKAWNHYTGSLSLASTGVCAVSRDECRDQEIPIIDDALEFKEHVSLDFSAMQENLIAKKAKMLKRFALQRGWLYRTDTSS